MPIVDDYPYNAQKHKLGSLCKRQHDWLGTGQSLRHISSYKCVFCDREYLREWSKANKTRKRKEVAEVTIIEEFDFSLGLHYLGEPCRRKHRYRDSGLSVRLLSNNLCFHCNQEYCRENREKIKARKDKWCLENKDKYQKANRSYYERNKERINRKNVECARRRFSTPEAKEIRSHKYKAYREKNLDSIKARKSAYYQTPKGRLKRKLEGKTNRHRRRASRWEKYSLAELQAKYSLFNSCCAYCGKQESLTIEHVVPLSDIKGWDKLDNIIPACRSCNSSKQDIPMLIWYAKQPFFNEERLWKIVDSLGESEKDTLEKDLLDPLGTKSRKRTASTEASLQQFHQDASGT